MINVTILKKKMLFCYIFWSKGAAILQYHSVWRHGVGSLRWPVIVI